MIVECIKKNDMYVHRLDDMAFDAEREIALIETERSFDYAFSIGCDRIYTQTQKFKMLYAEGFYNKAWTYINEIKGMLDSIEVDFDKVMNDEGLQGALGSVRINRLTFTVKRTTNGKNCDVCVC
jgi:hypothetical protein